MSKHKAEQFELPFDSVIEEIVDSANEIDFYLISKAPIESHRKDIDTMLTALINRVRALKTKACSARESGQHHFVPCGGVPRCATCGCDEDDAFVGGEECTYQERI